MKKNSNLVYSTRVAEYKGKLKKYQTEGNKFNNRTYGPIVISPYNSYQDFLYNRALKGLYVFSKEELSTMHWEKKKRIIKVHNKTKQLLNIWKQELSNKVFQKYFTPKFVNSNAPLARDFVNLYITETDPSIECNISFKTLGITKKQIINKLVEANILPKNFYELKPLQNGLPRLKQRTTNLHIS